jgi:hypothetical protein
VPVAGRAGGDRDPARPDRGVREIARRIAQSPSTVSRELLRNAATRGGAVEYRAGTAQWHAGLLRIRLSIDFRPIRHDTKRFADWKWGYLLAKMFKGSNETRRAKFSKAVVGSIVAASTVLAGLAGLDGPPLALRIFALLVAGLLSGGAAGLTVPTLKKMQVAL